MGNHDGALCQISMFLAGFIFFTPHRIAITCANHVVKRYHLPLGTVAMFVYRIHNLMELGSFAGTVINTIITLSSTKMDPDSKTTLKNCISGISIWLMFIWSIITYFSFMAGGEYGYFGEFFWNIVMLVFIYGVYSNSSMGIEGLNAPFYIVGLPLFGLFTFVFHKLYKYLYYIYFWDEYDYVLVLYQISIMIILSFATSIVWTVARVMDSTSSSDTIIDASVAPTNHESGKEALYGSGANQIKVERKNGTHGGNDGVPDGYVRYEHKSKDTKTPTFTLCSVKYNDIPLTFNPPIGGAPNVQAVYVYYRGDGQDNDHEFPLIVCVKKSPTECTYYKRGNTWTSISELDNKDPETLQLVTTDLQKLGDKLNDVKDKFEVKLEKTNGQTYKASPQAAGSDTINIEVVKPDNQNFKGFKHNITDKTVNRMTVHGRAIIGINELDSGDRTISGKQYVYVYYSKTGDNNHEKPYLICLQDSNNKTWYKRVKEAGQSGGYIWTDATTEIGSKNPDQIDNLASDLNRIKSALDGSGTDDKGYKKQELVVKLDYAAKSNVNTDTITYRTGDKKVTVSPVGPNNGYKGYKHDLGERKTIDKVKIHNIDTKITNGLQNKQYVYVYYADSDDKLQKPYLICLSPSGTTDPTNKWYKRERKNNEYIWKDVSAEDGYDKIDPGTINDKLKEKLGTIKSNLGTDKGYTPSAVTSSDKSQPKGLSLLFGVSDDGQKYHIIHWSPIFLVALSLGTVYFFYPAISPYQLVDDPFDGKKIELWIQAISATPHIAFAITQIFKKGPGRLWTSYYHENGKGDLYAIYHATWLFFIPYIICIYIFFSMMHFPNGRIGKYFRASVFRTGVLCVFFAWVQEFMEAVGFGGGMGAQVSGRCGDTYNDDAGTIFGFMFLVFMTFFMFTEDFA